MEPPSQEESGRPKVPAAGANRPVLRRFCLLSARLVVEIDSVFHEDSEKDQRKTEYLESRGFRVMRVYASETDKALDDVIESIWVEIAGGPPPHPDLPHR